MPLASFSVQFTWIDWLVVAAYLALTTWLGVAMAGRQATIRDFFLAGRKLPWYAVSGSIIATEISALTFVSVPWVVFQPGGNLTYLQLGLFGSLLARILVGYILVPAYYEREIYSPYDYVGHRLGRRARTTTTVLFTLGGLLGQSARVYLTAVVVVVLMNDQLAWLTQTLGLNELAWAVVLIMLVSTAWTLLGGMTTVVWTDVILFLAFVLGALVALGAVVANLPGGLAEMLRTGWESKSSGVPWARWGAAEESGPWGKFTFFDFRADPTRAYTFWAAIIAGTWGGVGAYGADQLMAQRMFCCKSAREARWAIISSAASPLVTVVVALVGVGLFAYYQSHTPSPEALGLLAERKDGDRILPVFIVEVLPVGLKGLIVAAIFAAAISSVMGILTALSQTSQAAFYNPLRERTLRRRGCPAVLAADAEQAGGDSAEDRRSVRVGRAFVLGWAILLALLAYLAAFVQEYYRSILDLGLSMAGYVGGALLAALALALLPLRIDGRGFLYSGPLSVLCVFALVWHQPWTRFVCAAGGALLLIGWLWTLRRELARAAIRPAAAIGQTAFLLLGVALLMAVNLWGYWPGPPGPDGEPTYVTVAWPWQAPFGSVVAFVWGVALARRAPARPEPAG